MIIFDNFALRRGAQLLFNHATFQLHSGWKIGVIGTNGSGKSSLFAALLGKLSGDNGELQQPKHWTIAHMAQEVAANSVRAIDFVLAGDAQWWQLHEQIQHDTDALNHTQLSELYEQFDSIDGYTAPTRAAEILYGLGFSQAQHDLPVADFSGGWRMRLGLARTLMCRSNLLLLDEPTNHLDLDALLWLEQWLNRYTGTLLLISHDRDFLDAIVDHTLHLTQQTLTLYTGNYSTFEQTRAERLAQQQQNFEKQQAVRAHLTTYINRFRAKATHAKQAQSRIKQLQRMEQLAAAHIDSPFNFTFAQPETTASPLIRLDSANLGYHATQPLLHHVDLTITPDTRLAIMGFNGAGKSTLIKALVGELPLLQGNRQTAAQLKLGYFAQHQLDFLDGDASPLLLLKRLSPKTNEAALRAFIGGFDFGGERMETPCGIFSGGERVRLALALLVWQKPNVLILDEPTNHLDLDMRHALTLALQDFMGAIVVISHDRQLINSVCNEFLLVHQSQCQPFDGDIHDYVIWMQNNKFKASSAPITKNIPVASPIQALELSTPVTSLTKEDQRKLAAAQRTQSQPIRRDIERLERKLADITLALTALEQKLSDETLYHADRKVELLALMSTQQEQNSLFAQTETQLLEQMMALEYLEHSFDH